MRVPQQRTNHAGPFHVRVRPVHMSKGLVNVFDLGSMTVEQLRDALQRRGLPVSGKKADLLERLRTDIRRAYDAEMAEMGISPPSSSSSSSLIPSKEEKQEKDLMGDMQGSIANERLTLMDQKRPRDRGPAAGMGGGATAGDLQSPEDFMLDDLPDYGKSPKHIIEERHVGWDGALKGYTLGDGTYVSVKEDPRLSEKELEKMDVELRKTVKKWEEEYPDNWAEFMAMCDAVDERGGGEGADDELNQMVKEVARLEKERAAMKLPMARKVRGAVWRAEGEVDCTYAVLAAVRGLQGSMLQSQGREHPWGEQTGEGKAEV